MHEFEKYPELAEQMQEYASFGRFGDWQKFTDVLNEALRQASKNLVKADVIGQLPNNLILYRQAKKLCYAEFCKWINAKLGNLR